MKVKFAIAGAAVAALALAGCSSSDDEDTEATPTAEETAAEESGDTIVDVASSNPDFSTLVDAVVAADLVDALSGPGPFTVFAPTNDAFAEVDQDLLAQLLLESNQEALQSVLTYHVLDSEIPSSEVPEGETQLASLEGSELTVVNEGGSITVNDANVIIPDVEASNGVIHAIDAVLLPPDFDAASLATE